MASELFIAAVTSVSSRKELQVVCSKTSELQSLAKNLLEAVGGNKKGSEKFAV